MEEVILVNENDQAIGLMEKMEAHSQGLLHRAFSVFVFNSSHQLLLQRRASSKYHSGGLWTNTCCSHPRSGEEIIDAGNRRLLEEMGISCRLSKEFDFIYFKTLNNNLIEHEFDHVLFGYSDDIPKPDPAEVEEWKYMDVDEIREDIARSPLSYTEWFKICFDEAMNHLQKARLD